MKLTLYHPTEKPVEIHYEERDIQSQQIFRIINNYYADNINELNEFPFTLPHWFPVNPGQTNLPLIWRYVGNSYYIITREASAAGGRDFKVFTIYDDSTHNIDGIRDDLRNKVEMLDDLLQNKDLNIEQANRMLNISKEIYDKIKDFRYEKFH